MTNERELELLAYAKGYWDGRGEGNSTLSGDESEAYRYHYRLGYDRGVFDYTRVIDGMDMDTMDDLLNDYVTRVIDGMDMDTLVMYAFDKMRDDLSKYTDAQLRSEIREYYPDLLEEYNYA